MNHKSWIILEKKGAGVLTCIRIWAMSGTFFQISSNFLSLISSYPLFKNVFQHTFISVNNRGRAPSKYLNKLAIGFIFLYRKLNNMDGVEQQYSTPQNDSILGFKWIKKITQNIVLSYIHNNLTYITGDYTKLCLNIICNR